VKIFLLIGPAFLEWPLAVCRALRADTPDLSICGLVTGPEGVFRRIAGAHDIGASPLRRLDGLERQWIATPVDPSARATYEAMLGDDELGAHFNLVHGSQGYEWGERALRPGDRLHLTTRIADIVVRRGNELLTLEVDCRFADTEERAVLSTSIDKYCYISCRVLTLFFGIRHRLVWKHIEQVNSISEILHPAVREGLRHLGFDDETGLEIQYQGDLPARRRLGLLSERRTPDELVVEA